MVLISDVAGPPHVHLNTDPPERPHYVGGGDRNPGNTKQMPRAGKKCVLSTGRVSNRNSRPI